MRVRYQPREGLPFTPGVKAGEVRDYPQAEAERLIATGAWIAVDVEVDVEERPAKKRRSRDKLEAEESGSE